MQVLEQVLEELKAKQYRRLDPVPIRLRVSTLLNQSRHHLREKSLVFRALQPLFVNMAPLEDCGGIRKPLLVLRDVLRPPRPQVLCDSGAIRSKLRPAGGTECALPHPIRG
jgi:hypothetical protein